MGEPPRVEGQDRKLECDDINSLGWSGIPVAEIASGGPGAYDPHT
jgi:hypothetical protein